MTNRPCWFNTCKYRSLLPPLILNSLRYLWLSHNDTCLMELYIRNFHKKGTPGTYWYTVHTFIMAAIFHASNPKSLFPVFCYMDILSCMITFEKCIITFFTDTGWLESHILERCSEVGAVTAHNLTDNKTRLNINGMSFILHTLSGLFYMVRLS